MIDEAAKAALFDALWAPLLVVFLALWLKARLRRHEERWRGKHAVWLQQNATPPQWKGFY